MYYVYVLYSRSSDEIYIGQTANLKVRLRRHNDPECRGTLHTKRRKGQWSLIYYEAYPTRSAAMRRERQLKSGAGRRFIRTLLEKKRVEGGRPLSDGQAPSEK
jgi:putative endonuclease